MYLNSLSLAFIPPICEMHVRILPMQRHMRRPRNHHFQSFALSCPSDHWPICKPENVLVLFLYSDLNDDYRGSHIDELVTCASRTTSADCPIRSETVPC